MQLLIIDCLQRRLYVGQLKLKDTATRNGMFLLGLESASCYCFEIIDLQRDPIRVKVKSLKALKGKFEICRYFMTINSLS